MRLPDNRRQNRRGTRVPKHQTVRHEKIDVGLPNHRAIGQKKLMVQAGHAIEGTIAGESVGDGHTGRSTAEDKLFRSKT